MQPGVEPVAVLVQEGVGLIDDAEQAKWLREVHRIVAAPFGTLRNKRTQNEVLGPPFCIDKYSLLVGLELQALRPLNESPQLRDWVQRERASHNFLVFRDLYRRNYYITSASKFGGQFLIYEKSPELVHAKAIVFTDPHLSLVDLNRAANNVNKLGVYAYADQQGELKYLTLQRAAGFQGKAKVLKFEK